MCGEDKPICRPPEHIRFGSTEHKLEVELCTDCYEKRRSRINFCFESKRVVFCSDHGQDRHLRICYVEDDRREEQARTLNEYLGHALERETSASAARMSSPRRSSAVDAFTKSLAETHLDSPSVPDTVNTPPSPPPAPTEKDFSCRPVEKKGKKMKGERCEHNSIRWFVRNATNTVSMTVCYACNVQRQTYRPPNVVFFFSKSAAGSQGIDLCEKCQNSVDEKIQQCIRDVMRGEREQDYEVVVRDKRFFIGT